MRKIPATLGLMLAAASLAACAHSGSNGAGPGDDGFGPTGWTPGYIGRFDTDENRRPVSVDGIALVRQPQSLTYGDGDH